MFVKQKAILTAVLAALLFVCFVNSSDAASITSLSAYATYDWGSGGYVDASLTTDADIYVIDWYIDDTYLKSTFHYHFPTRSVNVSVDTRTGEIKGVKYEIKAVAWLSENNNYVSDIETDTVRMFKPVWLYGVGERTGAWGYAEISKLYYNGTHIIMDSTIYAHNPSNNPKAKKPDDNPMRVAPWFWTQEYPAPDGRGEDERRDTKDPEVIEVGETSQSFTPGTLTDPDPETGERKPFDRFIGTLGEDDEVYIKGHAHLQVSDGGKVDDWEVDTQSQTITAAVTFTKDDGP